MNHEEAYMHVEMPADVNGKTVENRDDEIMETFGRRMRLIRTYVRGVVTQGQEEV